VILVAGLVIFCDSVDVLKKRYKLSSFFYISVCCFSLWFCICLPNFIQNGIGTTPVELWRHSFRCFQSGGQSYKFSLLPISGLL